MEAGLTNFDKVKIGIIGTGMIFEYHYNAFKKIKNAEVIGACRDFYGNNENQNNQKNKFIDFCSKFNLKPYFGFDEIVTDPEIDALIIGSINPFHYEHIMKSLDNKKHVLVEKPVVTEINQIKIIKEKAAIKGLKVFPGHNFVYRKAVITAKKIIDEGKIGNIIYSSFVSTHDLREDHVIGWRKNKQLSKGGALMESGHHLVYQSVFLRGIPKKVHAFKSNVKHSSMEVEDLVLINLLYPDNTIGSIMQSWVSNHGKDIEGVRLLGDKGSLVITDSLYLNGKKINDDVIFENSFCNQANAFIDCLINNKEPLSTIDNVADSLDIIYAAYKSTVKNKTVKIK